MLNKNVQTFIACDSEYEDAKIVRRRIRRNDKLSSGNKICSVSDKK